MKIGAIIGTGTYYSPWTPWTLASIYKVCDEIIIVNGGVDVEKPNLQESEIPLKQVSRDISELDVEGKIIEITDFSLLKKKVALMSQYFANIMKLKEWVDLRGRNYTLASEQANERGINYVMRVDTDEVCYADVEKFAGREQGAVLWQYEFVGDIRHLAEPPPDSPYNDSIEYYKIDPRDWYFGGRAPVIHNPMEKTPDIHCAHLRFANPEELSKREKFVHFYNRFIFSLWSNEFGTFKKALFDKARDNADALLETKGKPSTILPPEVTVLQRKYLREYIETKDWDWSKV